MRLFSLAFASQLAAILLSGCLDDTTATDTEADVAELGGTLVTTGGLRSTVAVRWTNWSIWGQSGVVIRPDAVLTLGWEYTTQHQSAASTYIHPNPTSVFGAPGINVDHVNIVPSSDPLGAPFAILYLKCSLDASLNPPAVLISSGKDFVKAREAQVAGYGGPTAPGPYTGIRQSATVPASAVTISGAQGFEMWMTNLPGQLGIGLGDSGGPIYLNVDNQWRLGGIIQYGSSYNSVGGHRIEPRLGAIAANLALPANTVKPPCPIEP